MMSHRPSRRASRWPTLALWVLCVALAHCVQLTDGPAGNGVPKTWRTPERIQDQGSAPEVAVDPAGNAVALWSQADGIWSSRYTPSAGWGTVASIQRVGGAELGTPMVAMDANGIALAVWSLFWAQGNIFSSECSGSGQWGSSPQRIDDDSGEAFEPQISTNADGSAVAVWAQFDGERDDVWSNRYTRSDGWSFAQRIETNNAVEASGPRVAVDPIGNATAAWAHSGGTRFDIWSNRYTPSGGWDAATLIETNDTGEASEPQVAVDAQGNVVTVWQQSDGTRYDIWSNRYTSAGWRGAERIETEDEGNASNPQVAVDAQGNAMAVWEQSDGARHGIWSNRYTPSRGWGTAERIDASNTFDTRDPRVAVDSSGDAVSVWRQSGTTGDRIWSNRYTPSGGWGSAQRIDSDHTGARANARVAVDANGNAIAVWSISGGSSPGIWSNRAE
jgi:hypothetical protein